MTDAEKEMLSDAIKAAIDAEREVVKLKMFIAFWMPFCAFAAWLGFLWIGHL